MAKYLNKSIREEFQKLMLNFWKEDVFRTKTYGQLSKDFGLCGIDIPISELEKCTSKEELYGKIEPKLSQVNIQILQ